METLAPTGAVQLQEIIHWAMAENRRLGISGSGTKDGFGNAAAVDQSVSTRSLCGILDYEPAELVMQAGAGTPLSEIEAALAANGQHLPFEPPRLGRLYGNSGPGTLGGAMLGNLSGPRRIVAGAARDHLLGITAVSGRGDIFKSGGRVIKNVTGYDLSKLLAGSWGTLAVATEFWIKVLPVPEISASLVVGGLSTEAGLALLRQVAARMPAATGLVYLPDAESLSSLIGAGSTAGTALVRVEGSRSTLRSCAAAVRALPGARNATIIEDANQSKAIWEAIRDVAVLEDAQTWPVILRISLPPAGAAPILEMFEGETRCNWMADQAGGWLWVGMDAPAAQRLVPKIRATLAGSGSAVLFRAPAELKQHLGVLSPEAGQRAVLMQRVKQSFDPQGILNPGRLFPV